MGEDERGCIGQVEENEPLVLRKYVTFSKYDCSLLFAIALLLEPISLYCIYDKLMLVIPQRYKYFACGAWVNII